MMLSNMIVKTHDHTQLSMILQSLYSIILLIVFLRHYANVMQSCSLLISGSPAHALEQLMARSSRPITSVL